MYVWQLIIIGRYPGVPVNRFVIMMQHLLTDCRATVVPVSAAPGGTSKIDATRCDELSMTRPRYAVLTCLYDSPQKKPAPISALQPSEPAVAK